MVTHDHHGGGGGRPRSSLVTHNHHADTRSGARDGRTSRLSAKSPARAQPPVPVPANGLAFGVPLRAPGAPPAARGRERRTRQARRPPGPGPPSTPLTPARSVSAAVDPCPVPPAPLTPARPAGRAPPLKHRGARDRRGRRRSLRKPGSLPSCVRRRWTARKHGRAGCLSVARGAGATGEKAHEGQPGPLVGVRARRTPARRRSSASRSGAAPSRAASCPSTPGG